MIRVYCADVSALNPFDQALLTRIGESRRSRVESCTRSDDRRRILGAGLLLANLFGDAPIAVDERGKPFIEGGPAFSVSHSGNLVLVAVGERGPVGCDIERRRTVDYLRVARRVFAPGELAFVERADDPALPFCRLWTLRESYLKAVGTGLSVDPASVCFDLADAHACLVEPADTPWTFREFPETVPGYALTVCGSEPVGDIEWVSLAP